MDGFICIDKPVGPSSFSAAQAVRKSLKIKKAGHAGTLDPMASGLLVVALGRCTRLLEHLSLEPKIYEFSVTFGRSTDTLDAEGNVIAESSVIPSSERLAGVLKNFMGAIEQTPPQYSAIKINGTPAYKLARKGVDMEMKSRSITIYDLAMCGYDISEKRADFTVSCSSGTYVRSLAADIVKAADVNAEGFVNKLRRTRTGRFDLSMAVDYQHLSDSINYIIDAGAAFDDPQKVVIDDAQKAEISKGRKIVINSTNPVVGKGGPESILIAFDGAGSLTAVLKRVDGDKYHPEKVFL
ncbi:MAG: tRNA pseudouridine(55) synthase TruB [Chitinispirillia bacterium]|nr:tRNA pseudouridine(55) synthase TruB [Chitinispirillia bacterium]MCL2240933.1 tRNA pseudouridine(55) synthase TruB [Chitinispirillia bacterium]MCL2242111.1 tRNA pseudouridine(55) synthase TruB [Chitinispirillia bacterium]